MEKRGNIFPIVLIGMLALGLLMLGVLMVIGGGLVSYTFDTISPEITGIGSVGDANITEISEVTLTPLGTIIDNFTWLTAIIYMFGMMGLIGIAFIYRFTGSSWLAPLFILISILVIISAIFVSNVYEDLIGGSDEITEKFKEHALLSWMIIYSPGILSIIVFLAGIIMFSGGAE